MSTAGCTVWADGRAAPSIEVVVWGRGQDEGFTEWQLKHPKPAWTLFPAEAPIGYAEPAYESRLEGTKMGELRKGAVANAVIGDWYINLRVYRPGKGRSAVPDAIMLVQQIAKALQLPSQPTRTYPPYTPSGPTPSSPTS
ncbi:hypothetical protein OG474_29255 [Kribbella sp. NBC_01505]|uniref:hypothetical protein n=1 Tax=Kribbella sp. NBC_01505 TaxID=2903580 RepID=UPI003870D842